MPPAGPSHHKLREAEEKIKKLQDEKEDLEECNDILTFNMNLFKKEASMLKLQNLELRETLKGKFRRTMKKEEEEEIQLPPMPDPDNDIDAPTAEKIAELESTITQLQAESKDWKGKYEESEAFKESLETRVSTLQEQVDALNKAWTIYGDTSASRSAGSGRDSERALLTALMGIHHPIVQRPLDLKPVKKLTALAPDKMDDLVGRFIAASTSSRDRSNILFFRAPGRVVWCREEHSNACLYAPMHQLSVSEQGLRWNAKTRPLQALYNQEMELMVLDEHNTIWYSGRYKLHKLHSYIPGGCSDLTTLSQHDLAKSTLSLEGNVPDSRYTQAMAFVSRLWTSPFMRAEVLGMQCVGFNKELYGSLRAKAETWNWTVPTVIKEPGQDDSHHRSRKRQRS